jgi:hypothetical protein
VTVPARQCRDGANAVEREGLESASVPDGASRQNKRGGERGAHAKITPSGDHARAHRVPLEGMQAPE